MSDLSRKDFLRLSVVIVSAAATGTLAAACSDPVEPSQPRRDVPPPTTGTGTGADGGAVEPTCNKELKVGGDKISANHKHELVIAKSDFETGAEKLFDIQGEADHPHDLLIKAEHFANLQDGKQIEIICTNTNGHTHKVTIKC